MKFTWPMVVSLQIINNFQGISWQMSHINGILVPDTAQFYVHPWTLKLLQKYFSDKWFGISQLVTPFLVLKNRNNYFCRAPLYNLHNLFHRNYKALRTYFEILTETGPYILNLDYALYYGQCDLLDA